MFIRRVTYRLAPKYDTPEGQAEFEAALKVHTRKIPGLISSAHVPQDDGTWLVAAVYQSEADALAASETVQRAYGENQHFLAEPQKIELMGLDLVDREWI